MTYIPQHREQLVCAASHLARRPHPRPRWRARWRPRRFAAAMVLVAGCLPAVVVAAVVGHGNPFEAFSPGDPPPAVDRAPAPVAGRPPADALLRDFAVLRRAQGPRDRLPAGRTVDAPSYYADQLRAVAPARPLSGPAEVAPGLVYVAGGADQRVCLLVLPPDVEGESGPAGQCQDVALAVQGRNFVTLERDGGALVDLFGIVPNGVDHVVVSLGDGRTARLPVVDNVYSADVAGSPRAVSFTTASEGAVRVVVGG